MHHCRIIMAIHKFVRETRNHHILDLTTTTLVLNVEVHMTYKSNNVRYKYYKDIYSKLQSRFNAIRGDQKKMETNYYKKSYLISLDSANTFHSARIASQRLSFRLWISEKSYISRAASIVCCISTTVNH